MRPKAGSGRCSRSACHNSHHIIAEKAGAVADRTAQLDLPFDGSPILVADLDGDGALDILVSGGAKAGVYRNDGTGMFTWVAGPVSEFLAKQGPYAHTAQAVHLHLVGIAPSFVRALAAERQARMWDTES